MTVGSYGRNGHFGTRRSTPVNGAVYCCSVGDSVSVVGVSPLVAHYLSPLLLDAVTDALTFSALSVATRTNGVCVCGSGNKRMLLAGIGPDNGFSGFAGGIGIACCGSSGVCSNDGDDNDSCNGDATDDDNDHGTCSDCVHTSTRHGNMSPTLVGTVVRARSTFGPGTHSPINTRNLVRLVPTATHHFGIDGP